MKLSKISVEKLFGIFDHEIKINNERGITIVIGENGLGKTIMLEIIESFFKGEFLYFKNVIFNKLIFEFDDNVCWTLTKEQVEVEGEFLIINQIGNAEAYRIQITSLDPEKIQAEASYIGRSLGHISRLPSNRWRNRVTDEIYNAQELIDKYGREILWNNYNYQYKYEMNRLIDVPTWYQERFEKMNVSLIETQRVFNIGQLDQEPVETVKKYSIELEKLIKDKLTESTELSSKLDRTYPNRLIDELKKGKSTISDVELNEKLNQLEEKRKLLDKVGLVETEKDSNLLEIDRPNDVVKDVLMLYIKDSFEKLSIYDEISKRIELLLKIINSRFKHKQLFANKDNGFLFKSTVIKDDKNDYKTIPIEQLSSGEKNELILFYELIFKSNANSLILIDEPEISLHISWQNKFISDLNEIHTLNKLDILIATHSPDIISNNWDLRVELKGVE
ncbi:AAA family ATPase [Bacillus mycoides]|uniref:AAA family ATPase n=1 Tax=Bacillus mycoides TaxID=1405 RepID=UPI00292D8AFD|nr:AAA family ATPase [Bacillus mycoides]WOA60674.1 AAA family ATPase [Bacillus mycoides]